MHGYALPISSLVHLRSRRQRQHDGARRMHSCEKRHALQGTLALVKCPVAVYLYAHASRVGVALCLPHVRDHSLLVFG